MKSKDLYFLHDKVIIKRRGRPLPDIRISQPGISNNKKYIRSFNSEWYQRKTWLCGCEVKNALFCFPCLLFGGDVPWTKDGVRNINKMKEKTEKHEASKKHIDNVVSLSLLGSINIKESLSEAYRLSIDEHNRKVTKNREILSKIIDCIAFCGNFEIPLRGHDERDDSVNPGVFKGLIDFASKLDPDLKKHLETSICVRVCILEKFVEFRNFCKYFFISIYFLTDFCIKIISIFQTKRPLISIV